jgi:hypothetical protein
MKNKLTIIAALCCGIVMLSLTASAQLKACSEQGSVRSVTKARSGDFETVTFEIVGRRLPQVAEVRDEKPPIENYGGDNLHMRGRAFKSVHFHLVPWGCRIREDLHAQTTTIKDVKQMEQFEGYVTYAIGYTPRSKYAGKAVIHGRRTTKFIVKFRR